MTHINSNLKKTGTFYGLQKQLLEKGRDLDEVFVDNCMKKRNACLDYVKIDVSSTAVGYA